MNLKIYDINSKLNFDQIVIDTSVLIEKIISKKLKNSTLNIKQVIVHEASVSELEHQANNKRLIGFLGLNELKEIQDLSRKYNFELIFKGERPRFSDIEYAKNGAIDAMIRELSYDVSCPLFSCDKVQSLVGISHGIEVIFFKSSNKKKVLSFEKFFDETTMSIHLKENLKPTGKKGGPGNFNLVEISDTQLKRSDLENIANEIIEEAESSDYGFIEIDRPGSTIVQLGLYRIVITRPSFSNAWEITIVKPIKKLNLDDYELNENLMNRLKDKAEGIVVSGAPGQGKSTFAQALAEYYSSLNKIVKTVEAPRDLQLNKQITQYAISYASPEEMKDVLLLTRPDFTIFDEMRNNDDFSLFGDLRLAGVGMLGVVHATNPVDAIHRFIGRIDLGMIPQILDTVIYIKAGKVDKVYGIRMDVRTPNGMTESDLSRPVVSIYDFETNALEFEIYTYGEETVIIPINNFNESQSELTSIQKLAKKTIENEFKKYSTEFKMSFVDDNRIKIELPEKIIPKIIGKQGKNINQLEENLGIKIDVETLAEDENKAKKEKTTIKYEVEIRTGSVLFYLPKANANQEFFLSVDDSIVGNVTTSKDAIIKLKRKGSDTLGQIVTQALNEDRDVKIVKD